MEDFRTQSCTWHFLLNQTEQNGQFFSWGKTDKTLRSIWFGTFDGVYRYDGKPLPILKVRRVINNVYSRQFEDELKRQKILRGTI